MNKLSLYSIFSAGCVLCLLVSNQAKAQFDLDKMLGSPVKKITQGIKESIRVAPSALIPGATFPIDKITQPGSGAPKLPSPGTGLPKLPSPGNGFPGGIKLPGTIGEIIGGGSSNQSPYVPAVQPNSAVPASGPVSILSNKVPGGQLPGINGIGRAALSVGKRKFGIGFGTNQPGGIGLGLSGLPSVTSGAVAPSVPLPSAPAASLGGASLTPSVPKFQNPFRK